MASTWGDVSPRGNLKPKSMKPWSSCKSVSKRGWGGWGNGGMGKGLKLVKCVSSGETGGAFGCLVGFGCLARRNCFFMTHFLVF